MSNDILIILIGVVVALFGAVALAYYIISKKRAKTTIKHIESLQQGTKESFSFDKFFQKVYIIFTTIPVIKRYTLKLRRRIEIINLGDEYMTRKQTGEIMAKITPIVFLIFIFIVVLTRTNLLLMSSLLLLLVFFVETIITGQVDKIDNKLLHQQIDFFAEIRHAYHEYNMVEEAIYEAAQSEDFPEVARQAEKIYEILTSEDPEMELEKYYDIAPNDYLKEFAGISYLTKEFGDRVDEDGASLYLKNLNNITQEMQIEILKRDKLDYVFQSLSFIAVVPILAIEPMKKWAVSQFGFTKQFYDGKGGLYVQLALIVLTTVCYILVRKLKDSGVIGGMQFTDNPWQNKLYKKPMIKKIVDKFIPAKSTKEYRVIEKLLKDSGSELKIEWLYVNKLLFFLIIAVMSVVVFFFAHILSINYVYTEPTADYDIMGSMGKVNEVRGMEKTKNHNKVLDYMKKENLEGTETQIENIMSRMPEFDSLKMEDFDKEVKAIQDKYFIVKNESLQWYEVLLSIAFGMLGYVGPNLLMKFQLKMRQLEMENEVMQYHTIILMLMKIERVSVEMILEWIERYSKIFRPQISKCVNNFESGAWEALEELKKDVSFKDLTRIVEALQAAVESIPIRQAFDELDTERAYYQDKRRDSNERLIARKSILGKAFGFAPMVVLFVGYLIVPLMTIGMSSMGSAFSSMQGM